jgi:hypothetical protein
MDAEKGTGQNSSLLPERRALPESRKRDSLRRTASTPQSVANKALTLIAPQEAGNFNLKIYARIST